MHDIFISYAMKDKVVADALVAIFEQKGIKCWIADRDLAIGDTWAHTIENAIQESNILLLIFSSSANYSNALESEVARAVNFDIPIIVLRVDETTPTGSMKFLTHSYPYFVANPPSKEKINDLTDNILTLISKSHSKLSEENTVSSYKNTKIFGRIKDQIQKTSTYNPVNVKNFDESTREDKSNEKNDIRFTVCLPTTVPKEEWFIIELWAHLKEQYDQIIEKSKEFSQAGTFSKSMEFIGQSTRFNIYLFMDGAEIDEKKDKIMWNGSIEKADFQVKIPSSYSQNKISGKVIIESNGLRLGRIYFDREIKEGNSGIDNLPSHKKLYKKAFASYSSLDRDEVLARIQGIEKALPELEVFLDVKSLRSNENYKGRLREEISSCDVFYLFWSKNASESDCVEKEWKCALKMRGDDIIDPVPLVSPDEIIPPKELSEHKHFYDWTLAFKKDT